MTALLALALALLPAEPVAVFESFPDLVYAELGEEKLLLDLVVPKGDGPFPLVVCFHGGAWTSGSRKDLTKPSIFYPGGTDGQTDVPVLENLARNGYAAASVSYRLAPKAKYPAQIEDAKTAVKFLRKNAKTYKLEPTKFAALGFSAGGHLAGLLGLTQPKDGFEGKLFADVGSEVQAVVDFFGPTDLCLYAESDEINKLLVPFLGRELKTDGMVARKASPLTYVHKMAAPFLIVLGTVDLIVPYIHIERLNKALIAEGVESTLLPIPWKGHGWQDPKYIDLAAKRMMQFLNATFKPKEASK